MPTPPAIDTEPARHRPGGSLIACLLNMTIAFLISAPAMASEALEYRVKAAYVFKFAGYVEWPDESSRGELRVAVVGAPLMTEELRRLFSEHSLGERPVRVEDLTHPNATDLPHILFVGRDETHRLHSWSADSRGKPILIISEAPGALLAGSMVNFVLVERRVRFEIALATAERGQLKLSARLLSAALAVTQEVPP